MSEFLSIKDQEHPTHSAKETIRLMGSDRLDDLSHDIKNLDEDLRKARIHPQDYFLEAILENRAKKGETISVKATRHDDEADVKINISDGRILDDAISTMDSSEWMHKLTYLDQKSPFTRTMMLNQHSIVDILSQRLGKKLLPEYINPDQNKMDVVKSILDLRRLRLKRLVDSNDYRTQDYDIQPNENLVSMMSRGVELRTGNLMPHVRYRQLGVISMLSLDTGPGLTQEIQYLEKLNTRNGKRDLGLSISVKGDQDSFSKEKIKGRAKEIATIRGDEYLSHAIEGVKRLRKSLLNE